MAAHASFRTVYAGEVIRCPRWIELGHPGNVRCTTALPPKAEVDPQSCYVAEVPLAD
jgi:hypothetical protein